MNDGPSYTAYHPRWLRSRTSTYWWLMRGSYLAFILRELSSVFVAWFVVFLLLLVRAISRGESAYLEFLAWSATPVMLILNLVSLLFVVFHAMTWFNLAPKAMVVRMGQSDVPPLMIAASNYAAWVVVSALLAWLVLRA
jgi:fumarate reductase subunit C